MIHAFCVGPTEADGGLKDTLLEKCFTHRVLPAPTAQLLINMCISLDHSSALSASATVSLPLVDALALRLAGCWRDQVCV